MPADRGPSGPIGADRGPIGASNAPRRCCSPVLPAVIPYFEPPSVQLGPLTLHAFGLLAALGILLGAHLAARGARRLDLDDTILGDAVPWGVAGGILGGHLLHVFGYHPELLSQQGLSVVLRIWDGQSSMGGVLGGLAGLLFALRRKKVPLLPYFDALALGVAPGWAVARLGCFLAHDHPGTLTDFPLAVAFPQGARHDLGLYDFFVLAAVSAILYVVARRPRPTGTLIALLALTYSIPRFFLDFLRATDVAFADGRYLGLTPAQYVSIGLVLWAAWTLGRQKPIAAPRRKPQNLLSSNEGPSGASRL